MEQWSYAVACPPDSLSLVHLSLVENYSNPDVMFSNPQHPL